MDRLALLLLGAAIALLAAASSALGRAGEAPAALVAVGPVLACVAATWSFERSRRGPSSRARLPAMAAAGILALASAVCAVVLPVLHWGRTATF